MKSIKFINSLLCFYLKAQIDFEENFIKIKNPNTILGFIPLGSKKNTVAINQIASVDSNFKLSFKDFIIGLIELAAAVACFYQGSDYVIFGVVLAVLGICTVINSFQLHFNINTNSGEKYFVSAFIFQKKKLDQAENELKQLIANRMDDTNNRKATEVQTSTLVDAIKESKK